MTRRALILAAGLLTAPSFAESALTLDEVFSAVEKTHPSLEKASQSLEKANAQASAAQGAWDPLFSIRGQQDVLGYYENQRIESSVRQFTPLLGTQLFAGYRLGVGNFPLYKGDLATLSSGELRAGIDLPLWKDSLIDSRRADIQRTHVLAQASSCDLQAVRIKVLQDGAKAYFKWLAAGQDVHIQKNLLRVAEQRDVALTAQAALGKIPEIVVVDNQRLVLDRKSKLLDARREFSAATMGLSLYLRDEKQVPVLASDARLPSFRSVLFQLPVPDEKDDVAYAYQHRPELCRLQKESAASQVDVNLAENQRAPGLTASAFASKDLGTGPTNLMPAELGVGLRLEMPLFLTKARGDVRSARATYRGVQAQSRDTRDQILAQVRQARVEVQLAQEQLKVAALQVAAADRLAEAERMRFEEGASDLLVVNLRELAAAEAERLEVKALENMQRAWVEYLATKGMDARALTTPTALGPEAN